MVGLTGNAGQSNYAASKGAIISMVKGLCVELGPRGVTVNCVAPGWIDTDLNLDFIENLGDPDEFRAKIGTIHPVGRTGAPEEVASLVTWLASPEAGFVTGQVWTVDGGRMSQLSLP